MRPSRRAISRIRAVGAQPLGLSFGTSVGIQALNVVSGVLLARTLGPHGRGELAAALLLPTLLAVLGGLGLSEAATFHVARGTSSAGALIGTLLVLTGALSLLLLALGAALVPVFLANYDASIVSHSLIFLLYVPLYLLAFNFTGVLNGMHRFGGSNTLRILVIVLTVIGVVTLAATDSLTVARAVLVYLVANLANAAVACVLVLRTEHAALRFDRRLSRELVVYGLKTHTSAVSALVNERVDQLAITLFLGPSKLGLYVVAFTLTSATALIGSSVGMVALPIVAHFNAGRERMAVARNFVGVTFLLGTGVSAVLIIFAPELIKLFFGGAFAGSTDVCRVLLVAAIFFSTNRVIGNILKALNRPLDAGIAEVIAMAVTISGLAALLPLMGIMGAGLASLAAYAVATAWMAYRAGRALDIAPLRLLVPAKGELVHQWQIYVQPRLAFAGRHGWTSVLLFATAGLGVAATVGIAVAASASTEWFGFALLVAVLVLTTVSVSIVNARRTGDALSLLALTAGYYLVAFAVGAIYYWVDPGPFYGTRFTHSDITEAVGLATLGWIALLIGYILNPLKPFTEVLPALPRVHASTPVPVVIALNVLGWPARFALIGTGRYFHTQPISSGTQVVSTGSSWFILMLSLLPTLAMTLLGAHTFRRGDRTRSRKAFWILLAVEIAWYVPTGERGSLVALALIVLLVRYYSFGNKMPWRTVAVASALLLFVVFPFGLNYRGDNRTYQLNTRAALTQAFHQTAERFRGGPGPVLSSGFTATFTRFSDVASLSLITEQGRGAMGLRPGETLVWTVQGFIPRALDPDKADPGLFGNRFGRAYGVVSSDNFITSIAASQVGEFYLNFGPIGILLGLPCVGALYRLINDYFRTRRDNAYVLALYAVAAWPFVSGLETIVALGLVGVVKMLIFLGLILFVVGKLLAVRPLRRERGTAVEPVGRTA